MANPYVDSEILKLRINGMVGLAERKPPDTPAEFDSEVSGYNDPSSNADLTITLRVWFEPKGPPSSPVGHAGVVVKAWGTPPMKPIRPGYDDGDFAAFKRIVLQEANSFWNGKMWLVTPANYDGLDLTRPYYRNSVRPNIHCLFNAVEAESPGQAHLSIACWRLADGTDSSSFASASHEYDNYDVVPYNFPLTSDVGKGADRLPAGTVMHRLAVWHEMGHAIGQYHVAKNVPACRGTVDNCEYGDSPAVDPWMTRNVMGMGAEIAAFNGKPWAKRMARHTRGLTVESDWITRTARPDPQPLP